VLRDEVTIRRCFACGESRPDKLDGSCTGEQMRDQRDHCQDQEYVNQEAGDMEKQETARPQEQQKNRDSQKWSKSHFVASLCNK